MFTCFYFGESNIRVSLPRIRNYVIDENDNCQFLYLRKNCFLANFDLDNFPVKSYKILLSVLVSYGKLTEP